MQVFNTTKVKKHNHILIIRNNGEIVCTEVQGHVHPIVRRYAVVNPETNEVEVPAGFDILTEKNHSHKDLDGRTLVREIKIDKLTDEQKVQEVIDIFRSERNREEKSRVMGYEAERFCDANDQWLSKQREYLKKRKRACLTVNKIFPKIETLEGHFAASQKQIVAFPVEGGDQIVADALTMALKQSCVDCNYEQEEMAVWHDEIVPGRGITHVYIDRSKNLEGDVVFAQYKWDYVYFGEHLKMDGSDIEHYTKRAKVSYVSLIEKHPSKKEELKQALNIGLHDDAIADYNETTNRSTSSYGGRTGYNRNNESELGDETGKNITLLEQTRKIFRRSVTVHDELGGEFSADNWADEDLNQLKTVPFLMIIPREYCRLLVRTVAMTGEDNGILLYELWKDDEYKRYKEPDFDLFPTYYHRYIGEDEQFFFGKVELAKDPQRESNKYRSLLADIAVKMVSRSTYYEKGMFENKKMLKEYKAKGNDPGSMFAVKDVNRIPVKEEGIRVPIEYFNMLNICDEEIDKIMNINDAFSGYDTRADDSGKALLQKQKQSETGNKRALKNFTRSKLRAFRHGARLIQECWTTERFMRMMRHEYNSADKEQGLKLGGKKVVETSDMINQDDNPDLYITMKEIERLLNTSDLTKYDVRFDESELTPTMREAYVEVLSGFKAAGEDVNMAVIYELMNLPHSLKTQLIEGYREQTAARAQMEQEKIRNEHEKPITAGEYKLANTRLQNASKNQNQASK